MDHLYVCTTQKGAVSRAFGGRCVFMLGGAVGNHRWVSICYMVWLVVV